MENGVEALHIAFGMLIFVLAISITISCFSSASQALRGIWNSRNLEEQFITDSDGHYLNYIKFDGGTREVGVETIIPMMYRAYREDFAIYFYNPDRTEFVLYKYKGEEINYIDLNQDEAKRATNNIATPAQFLDKILGKDIQADSTSLEKTHTEDSLYQTLSKMKFTEMLGWYYIEGNTDVAEVNKIKKRVIAYVVN